MNINCSENCKNKKNGRCILNYISPFLSIHGDDANCAYFVPQNKPSQHRKNN